MRTAITKLWIVAAALVLSMILLSGTAHSKEFDEQAQYDQAMELIDNWDGRNSNLEKATQIALMIGERNHTSVRAGVILCRAVWLAEYVDEDTYSRRQLEETQACYRKVIEAAPEFPDAVYYLAMSHAMVKEYDQAMELAEQLVKQHPVYFRGYLIRMAVAEKKKDYKELLQLCLDQQNRFPDNEKSLTMTESYLLTAYIGLNMLDQAEAIHIKRVQEQPNSTRPLRDYAAFLRQYKHDDAKADEYDKKALALLNDGVDRNMQADAAVKKGNELLVQENYEEAEPYFKLALEKEPDYREAWAGLAQVNYHLGKQNNDLERMRKALEAISKAKPTGKDDPKYDLESMRIEMELLKMKHEGGNPSLEILTPPRPVIQQTRPSRPVHIEKVKPSQRQP